MDNITHFLGGHAVSQIFDSIYGPLAKRYEKVANIPKELFVVGSTLMMDGVNEIMEKNSHIFFST